MPLQENVVGASFFKTVGKLCYLWIIGLYKMRRKGVF